MPSKSFHFRSINDRDINIVNICDNENIGTTISEGDYEIEISEDYFGGTIIDENQAIELLKKSDTLNLVGNNIVDLAITLELVSLESIKKIEGVSFVLIYKFLQ
tara:strand:+ start:2522 stop:2833 length:312 start_codon:yes stop_codon:yes gene_type:complete